MKIRSKAAWAVALAITVLPVCAQSVPPGDRTLENAFFASDIQFLHGPGPILDPQLAGFNLQTVSGFGPGYVYDFCADFFTGNNDSSTFQVSSGFGGLDSGRQDDVRALFSNALPAFNGLLAEYIALNGGDWAYNAAFANEYDDLQGYAAGMQIALWEIIHEQTADLSIEGGGATPGSFRIDASPPPNVRAGLGANYAEQFLTDIGSGSWMNDGRVVYYFADAPEGEQDRLWMTIPEPSAAVLGTLGFLCLLRRRRF